MNAGMVAELKRGDSDGCEDNLLAGDNDPGMIKGMELSKPSTGRDLISFPVAQPAEDGFSCMYAPDEVLEVGGTNVGRFAQSERGDSNDCRGEPPTDDGESGTSEGVGSLNRKKSVLLPDAQPGGKEGSSATGKDETLNGKKLLATKKARNEGQRARTQVRASRTAASRTRPHPRARKTEQG